ncbi:MAG: hypothetical protein J3Q66DRAFT_414991 [Benniella sp.]|nr:MAG: hypothetical protein J3Q66DRAFT_414991 [Benniella sp.]
MNPSCAEQQQEEKDKNSNVDRFHRLVDPNLLSQGNIIQRRFTSRCYCYPYLPCERHTFHWRKWMDDRIDESGLLHASTPSSFIYNYHRVLNLHFIFVKRLTELEGKDTWSEDSYYFACTMMLPFFCALAAPEPEPESQAVVLYRPRASASTIDHENASKAMLPLEVELPDRVLESSIESSLLTPRAGSRGAVPMRPFVSSQYVGLSTANYFRRASTTTTATMTNMTQSFKASSASRPTATPRPREQQSTRSSSSNARPPGDVRSSRTMPIQAPSMSASHQRRIDHRDPGKTSQSRPMREPMRQVHHDARAPAAPHAGGREHTVLDLAEYALAHNLMDHELFMVLHKRAVKELVHNEHKERFIALMDQFYGPHGDSEPSESEVVPVQTLARAMPAPTREDLNQAQRQSQQPRREEANQGQSRDQPQVRKRSFDQLDFISPGRVISMKRTRTEYYNPSDHPRR